MQLVTGLPSKGGLNISRVRHAAPAGISFTLGRRSVAIVQHQPIFSEEHHRVVKIENNHALEVMTLGIFTKRCRLDPLVLDQGRPNRSRQRSGHPPLRGRSSITRSSRLWILKILPICNHEPLEQQFSYSYRRPSSHAITS